MPRKRTQMRREELIAATRRLLRERPPAQVSTRDVAALVGISQPAVFKHFEDRDELFRAVVDHVADELKERAGPLLNEPPLPALLLVCECLLSFAGEHAELPRLLVFDSTRDDVTGFKSRLDGLIGTQRSALRALVEAAISDGSLPSELDATTAADALVAIVQGTLLRWLRDGRVGLPLKLGRPSLELWLAGVKTGTPRRQLSSAAPVAATRRPLEQLDVRPILDGGRDPFQHIEEAAAQVAEGGLLELLAPFEPVPLIRIMRSRGATVTCECIEGTNHRVWIQPSGGPPPLVLLDLPAPEPMEAVLEAAERLEHGQALLALVPRYPKLLLPHLERRDLAHAHIDSFGPGTLLFLQRRDSALASGKPRP